MLYSENLNLAFVHITKTGGSSFRVFLQESFPDMRELPELNAPHNTVAELFKLWHRRGRDPLNIRIVTLIRHPFAHVASQYVYWRSDLISEAEQNLPHVVDARSLAFSDFVRVWGIRDEYARMLLVNDQLPENVHIIRTEHLQDDAEHVLNHELKLNVEVSIPYLNRTPQDPFVRLHTEKTEAMVREGYRWYFQGDWLRRIQRRGSPPAQDHELAKVNTDTLSQKSGAR